MDDISFFDTSKLGTRGGIFSEAGKVAADQAILEMGVEPIAQPAVIAGEDPASAIAETATLRLRHPSKSMTLDGTPLSEIVKEETPEIGLPRTDSAPPTLANGTSAKKGTAVLEIKNWFPGNGRSPSLSSQTVVNESHNASQESLDKPISRDNEIEKLAAQYAIGPVLPESGSASESSTRPSSPPMKGDSSVNSLGRAPSNSSDSALTERAIPAPDNAAASSSTTALLNNIRARDKKAIQTQVNSARDAVKKWGVNWAAKRRTNIPSKLDERDEDRPAALYRPAEEDEGADQSSTAPLSPTSSQSLKDRLNAAANAPHALPNRVRSTSSASHDSASSSRPSLLPSPSKTTVAPVNHSSSPPKWTLASSRPITEVATDTVPAPNPSRRSSGSAVYVQPSAGRTMVVPRVPKRPGEVTGMGSHPVQGMVRRVSTEDRTELERDQQRPALAPRPSTEEPLPTDHSVSVPPPSHPLDPLRQSPLPTANEPRTDEAIISDDQLAESALSISSTPPPEEALVRSESAPLSISLHSIPIPKDPLPVPIAQNGVSTAAKLASSQDGSTEAILDDDQLAETPQEFTGTAENSGALRLMARRDSKAMISAV